MNQPYFILEFAHSIHGQFKQIHLSYRFLKYFASSVLVLLFLVSGLAGACLFMTWKVARYRTMQEDLEHLRTRYQTLQQVAKQRGVQIASLESLASEVSAAYGLGQHEASSEQNLSPIGDVQESVQAFNLLKAANYSNLYHRYAHRWQQNTQPSAWPLTGLLRSSFGERSDPFSGEGAFHTGIDLSAASGTSVHVTADGVVVKASWGGAYGNLVVVDHGNGVQTYYAHLSEMLVVSGQDVRLGQVIALSGGTGRATSPHLHYEVRIAGTPVNPYRFLNKEQVAATARPAHDDLGL